MDYKKIKHEDAVSFLKEKKIFKAVSKGPFPGELKYGVLFFDNDLKLSEMRLDHDFAIDEDKGPNVPDAVIVNGNLTIDNLLQNGEQDFGPVLIVLGDLTVKNAAMGGAPIWVFGNLNITGAYHGYYNHGFLHVAGDVNAELFFADDYYAEFCGKVTGKIINLGSIEGKIPESPDIEDILLPELYEKITYDDDDDYDLDINSNEIYNSLVAGKSIMKK